ncbi:MAG: phosphatidic acid phosphatase, partial [Oscillospiraceae bacterium]
ATITLIPLSLGLFFAESADFYKAYGLYIGFVIGIIIEKQVNFNIPKSLYKKIIRFLVGIVLLAIFKIGLKVILPENIIFDMARYCFISLFGIGIYPLIFKKLKF